MKKTASPSRNSIAIAIAKKTGKAPRTVWGWYDRSMPDSSLEEAEKWVAENIKDRPPAKPSRRQPVELYPPADLKDIAGDLDTINQAAPDLVDSIVRLRNAGESSRKIAAQLGLSMGTVSRVIRNHPLTKSGDKEIAIGTWRDIRRLAAERIKDLLENDEAAAQLRLQELTVAAGIAHDKIKDCETPAQIGINIRAKIEAMSYEELINSIPKQDALDGYVAPSAPSPPLAPPRTFPNLYPSADQSTPEDPGSKTRVDLQQSTK
jgi:hypothetical protein